MSDHIALDGPVSSPSLFMRMPSDLKGIAIPVGVFLLLYGTVLLLSSAPLAYFDYQYITSGGLTLAIAATGATIVILTGGFDLSVGAVVGLVNVVVATSLGESMASQIGVGCLGILIGASVGAVNGFFVAYLRLQSIVVTLSTLFIVSGLALLWLENPGGSVPASFSAFFVGSAIEDLLPAAVVVLAAVAAIWLLLKNTRFGTALYAVGSDEDAAAYSGVSVRHTKFFAYIVAGAFYGLAGLVVTAQTSTGDPLVGQSLLLETFAAVVLGGTLLGGGRGGCIGTLLGAYSLVLITNILLVLSVPAFYSTIVQSAVLVLAAVGFGLTSFRESVRWLRSAVSKTRSRKSVQRPTGAIAADVEQAGWLARNKATLSYVLPSYAVFVAILAVSAVMFGGLGWTYFNSLLLLSSFLVVLALGQGSVILSGGLDLSVPWTITICGILIGELSYGSNNAAIWAIPAVLCLGILIGAINGFSIVFFRLPAIVVTLAMNGVLQGASLVYTQGTLSGFVPSFVKWFMTGSFLGVIPVVLFVIAFAAAGMFLLGRTTFGRKLYAVGNNPRVAHLSGVNVGSTIIAVYALSGLCSALVGIMLAGFSGRAILGMGDQYLLPSIAVVVIGGTLITGGRGRYVGMLGGVLLLVSLQILLAGTTLPDALRQILFGLVVLTAVAALRERHAVGK